jgi:hypothetical protein
MDKVLPDVSTSLSTTQLLGMMTQMGKYKLGDNTGFPFDRGSATLPKLGQVVVPATLATNVEKLHQFLYNEDSYKVSPTVQKISDTIQSKVGK